MRHTVPALFALVVAVVPIQARGLLIPNSVEVPPLALASHRVHITIDDQVSATRVEQVFRNHTSRILEATYIFPVPKGASVNKLTMWLDGKEVKGELVEAAKARQIYTDIVRRTEDPALLEYMGQDLLKLRVFPIPAQGEQKLSVSFTSVAGREGGLIEYVYPLKSEGKATAVLEEFALTASIASQHGVANVYSPTHAITLTRRSDEKVDIAYSRKQAVLDRDFQLFYHLGARQVGMTALTHRPIAAEEGSLLLLVSPQLKLAQETKVPRDLVLVLDTSGSMSAVKMAQARKALKYCLERLEPGDRFGLISFATVVNRYRDELTASSAEQLAQAGKWIDSLTSEGGTNINDALQAALDMRAQDASRSFTVAFFTDGLPTIGEQNPEAILKNVMAKNSANTRIFTFGVGDDVNTTLLSRLADRTRAWTTFVRPTEDIEVQVSSLHGKIAHPIMTNLKLTTTGEVRLKEMYPPQLPDLFAGSQLVVLGRFTGKGPAAIKLSGQVGKTEKEFVYELTFPEKTGDERQLVEHLWARRKVGYLLNEIQANGEKKELVEEVKKLASKHGIATPYTSYLVVPDGVPATVKKPPVSTTPGIPNVQFAPGGGQMLGLMGGVGGGMLGQFGMGGGMMGQFGAVGGAPRPPQRELRGVPRLPAPKPEPKAEKPAPAQKPRVVDFARNMLLSGFDGETFAAPSGDKTAQAEARRQLDLYLRANQALTEGDRRKYQSGTLGVDLSIEFDKLRQQQLLDGSTRKRVGASEFQLLAGVWLDRAYKEKTPVVVVKALSDAYFLLLEKRPEAKEVLRLGNRLVWVTASGTALIIDPDHGENKLDDKAIEQLFTKK